MEELLPKILNNSVGLKETFPHLVDREIEYIIEAKGLLDSKFYSYSLLVIWNAAVNNLKRKVEAYGIELWSSVVKDESDGKNMIKMVKQSHPMFGHN